MTIVSHDFKITNLDKSQELKIIQIGQIEAEIFVIPIIGSKPKDLYRENMFFHFSSNVATDSLRYVTFIILHQGTMILSDICIIYPQNLFFLDP